MGLLIRLAQGTGWGGWGGEGNVFSVELGPDCEEGLEGQAKVSLTGNKVTSPGPPALPSVQLSTAWKTVPLPAPKLGMVKKKGESF